MANIFKSEKKETISAKEYYTRIQELSAEGFSKMLDQVIETNNDLDLDIEALAMQVDEQIERLQELREIKAENDALIERLSKAFEV